MTAAVDQPPIRRYLSDDFSLNCDSGEYSTTRHVALFAIGLWPVGTPLLYTLLLWACRDAIRTGRPTPMSRATAFLSEDYKKTHSGGSPSRCAAS
eukprot:7383782-Prymnesium_polylepis.1